MPILKGKIRVGAVHWAGARFALQGSAMAKIIDTATGALALTFDTGGWVLSACGGGRVRGTSGGRGRGGIMLAQAAEDVCCGT